MSQALVHVSDKLGYGTEKVFKIYAEAQQAKAVADIAGFLTTLTVLILAVVGAWKLYQRLADGSENEDSSDSEASGVGAIFYLYSALLGVAITAVAAAEGGSLVHDLVMRLMAPEYMAVQEIMSQVGEVIG